MENKNVCIVTHMFPGDMKGRGSQACWFTPVIQATWEVEIRKIEVWGLPGQKVGKTPILTNKNLGVVVCNCLYSQVVGIK
jgi:hypothetical protein